MSISSPFIHRPVATTLITVGIAIAGGIAFKVLPVAPLPEVDFPTISVNSSLPGGSAEIMASSVATPLERQFGHIAGVTEMTSASSLGSTSLTIQFDLSRDIDGAARDVEAGINASRAYLPANLPSNPSYRKVNPADSPIMIIGLTSDKYGPAKLYDVASTIMEQKLSQVQGVGQVNAGGGAPLGARGCESHAARQLRPHTSESPIHSQPAEFRHAARADLERHRHCGHRRQRTDFRRCRLQAAHRRLPQWRRRSAVGRRQCYRFRAEHPYRRVSEWQARRQPDHFPPAGRQHHSDRRCHQAAAPVAEGLHSSGHRRHHGAGPHHHDPRLHHRRRTHAHYLHHSRHLRRLRFSAKPARDADTCGRRADFPARHFRGDVSVRI